MGFLQLLMGRDKYSISASTVGDEPLNPEHRTALIMPICNEDVDRVFAGLRATWESVKATGNAAHFDVYILSDSYNPDICVAEQKAWMELIAEVQGKGKSSTAVVVVVLSVRAGTLMTSVVAGVTSTATWWFWMRTP